MPLIAALGRQRQVDFLSSRLARATQRNPVSKNKNKNKQTKSDIVVIPVYRALIKIKTANSFKVIKTMLGSV